MTGDVVYNAVLNAIRADKRGNSLTVDEFNILSKIVNRRVFDHYAKDFEKDINNTDSLGFLKTFDVALNPVTGVASLPSDYYRMISDPYYTDTGGTRRNIDVVSSMEHSYRQADYLTQASLTYPTCVLGDEDASKYMQIRVYPTSISTVYINYLRVPATPFLDYYITNATMEYTFLAAGASGTLSSSYTYRTGVSGAYSSVSTDYEWGEDDLALIVAFFMQELGRTLPDELILQSGLQDKAEISND